MRLTGTQGGGGRGKRSDKGVMWRSCSLTACCLACGFRFAECMRVVCLGHWQVGVKRKELSGRVVWGTWTGPRVGHMRIKGKIVTLGFPARETREG